MNRFIKKYDFDVYFVFGFGYGVLVVFLQFYFEGVYFEVYFVKFLDVDGLQKFFKYFLFLGGIGFYVILEILGLIYEGGELGYLIFYVFGLVFDYFDLIVFIMVGDGEVEMGLLVIFWYFNKFLNLIIDGVVLLVLYFNGYKINNLIILV